MSKKLLLLLAALLIGSSCHSVTAKAVVVPILKKHRERVEEENREAEKEAAETEKQNEIHRKELLRQKELALAKRYKIFYSTGKNLGSKTGSKLKGRSE